MDDECDGTQNDGVTNPVFTSDEIEDNTKLTVLAKSDGDEQSVDLYLEETGRFTGRYEGYVRLTDANGDGSADEDDASTAGINEANRQDWGLKVAFWRRRRRQQTEATTNRSPYSASRAAQSPLSTATPTAASARCASKSTVSLR